MWLVIFKLSDLDVCVLFKPCHHKASCSMNNGFYECTCNEGYTGDGYEYCNSLNFTQNNNTTQSITNSISACLTNNCGKNAFCYTFLNNSFCFCHPGFTGDGHYCVGKYYFVYTVVL